MAGKRQVAATPQHHPPICPECANSAITTSPVRDGDERNSSLDAGTAFIIHCAECGHIVGTFFDPNVTIK